MPPSTDPRRFLFVYRVFLGMLGVWLFWYGASCLSTGSIRFLRMGGIVLHRDTEPAMFWVSIILVAASAACTLLLAILGNIGARGDE